MIMAMTAPNHDKYWQVMDSSHDQVKPKSMKLVFAASPLST